LVCFPCTFSTCFFNGAAPGLARAVSCKKTHSWGPAAGMQNG
jgi:hypothetical protein